MDGWLVGWLAGWLEEDEEEEQQEEEDGEEEEEEWLAGGVQQVLIARLTHVLSTFCTRVLPIVVRH